MERIAKTLSALDNTFGVSGEEEAVAAQIKKELEGFYDSCKEDALGNIILTQNARGGNKKIALAAHMDEIGFIVRYIDDNGQIWKRSCRRQLPGSLTAISLTSSDLRLS